MVFVIGCGDSSEKVPDPVCGDGLVEGNEMCDDGNDVDTDSCNNVCSQPGCGDGVINFDEACDDGNDVEGDGCDTNCTQSFCGNGIKDATEACDDSNTVSGDGCDVNCKATACGNGAMSTGEVCDDGNSVDGDGCDSNCTVTGCGNDIVGANEQCDDGNIINADGCSAICTDETLEVEPNDDGTPATGASGITGNDFSATAADANFVTSDSATIVAALDPVGDEDVFKLTNTGTVPARVRLDTWNLSTGFGLGMPCGTTTGTLDTGIQVKNAAGTVLASNDDKATGDNCAGLTIALFPTDVVYVQVVEFGDNAAAASYALDIKYSPAVCGDGDVQPGEQCDDMNTAAADGCSATCQIEGAYSEVEPNEDGSPSTGGTSFVGNDFGSTHPLNNGVLTTDVSILGSLTPLGDEDVFAFTNTRLVAVEVTFDVWSMAPNFGIGVSCGTAFGTVDTVFQVRDASGGALVPHNDDRNTTDNCSKITFSLFPGETRFLHLTENGDNAVIPAYALVVKYANVICGDMDVGLGEQCDDGNTTSGDLCDSTCQIEPFCGDSIMQPVEQCDDGNMTAGDGCDSTCQVEDAVTELEPNEDGSISTGGSGFLGNDFASANADANGVFTTSTRIAARLTPAGDEDVFAFRNPGTEPVLVQFNTWNNAPGFGFGVSCGTSTASIETGLQIKDAAGTSLTSNDDKVLGDNCAGVAYAIFPGQTVYAQVVELGDNAAIASYTLDVVYAPFPCGDGAVGVGEQCDDSNTASGDGCTNFCQLENAVNETEPNEDGSPQTGGTGIVGNDFSIANANGPFTTSKRIIAKLAREGTTLAGDEDVFAFTNPLAGPVIARFDTWDLAVGKGIGVACGTTIDTGITIRTATGTSLAANDDRNGASDRCSGLTITLAQGATVYAHIVESGDNSNVPSYLLDVVYSPIICGDGVIGPNEQCDDSNATSGDGCSSTCQYELVCGNGVLQAGEQCDDANIADSDGCSATCVIENRVNEVEPNNTMSDATANAVQISGNVFVDGAITPAGDLDRFQVTVATSTTVRFETFTSSGDCSTATIDLRLFDSTGASIANDLEGAGVGQCGALTIFLGAGTYQVQVEERGNNLAVASYLLQVSFQANGGNESEPNETIAAADANLANETYVFGNHMTVGDVDVYEIVVPGGGHIRAEIVEGDRPTETCEGSGIDSHVTLLDDTGATVAEDNDSGRGLCSLIDGSGSAPLDSTARNASLLPKTYYLMVRASAFATTSAAQFVYRLQVTVR
ncbi:MAG: DUF4215 domain-containing protein [Myxococcota bacterium]|nr:DUF4215 domain-containing protein [Myxococcota bacterium]